MVDFEKSWRCVCACVVLVFLILFIIFHDSNFKISGLPTAGTIIKLDFVGTFQLYDFRPPYRGNEHKAGFCSDIPASRSQNPLLRKRSLSLIFYVHPQRILPGACSLSHLVCPACINLGFQWNTTCSHQCIYNLGFLHTSHNRKAENAQVRGPIFKTVFRAPVWPSDHRPSIVKAEGVLFMFLSGVLCWYQIEHPRHTEFGTLFAPLFANATKEIYYP